MTYRQDHDDRDRTVKDASLEGWIANVVLLCVMMVLAGAGSLWMGQDASWDLKNYHWYNAYAFLNGRMGWDIAPAQVQTYINPLLDLLHYWLFSTFDSPMAASVLEGALFGISAFLLFKIAFLALDIDPAWLRMLLVVAAVTVGTTGSAVMTQLGLSSHECVVSSFVLAGLLTVMRINDGLSPARKFLYIGMAGLLVGLGTGLKLTIAPYAVALFVTVVVCRRTDKKIVLQVLLMGVCATIGFLAIDGYWMWYLYTRFDSPFFPFFNGTFHSPYWELVDWADHRFFPRNLMQYILYPFYWAQLNRLAWEAVFRDLRLATAMALGMLTVARACCASIIGEQRLARPDILGKPLITLLWFVSSSYVAWLFLFSNYRYAVVLEMLSGVLIVCFCAMIWRSVSATVVVVGGLVALLLSTTIYPYWERIQFRDHYLQVKSPELPAHSLVLLLGLEPIAYVIPFLNADARFISPWNNFMHPDRRNLLQDAVHDIVARHDGPMFVLTKPQDRVAKEKVLGYYGLEVVAQSCEAVLINIGDSIVLCRLARIGR